VGSLYALGNELADFKAVHSLGKGLVDSAGTHCELRRTRWLLRGGTELAGSDMDGKRRTAFVGQI
jgi:hypothetical protein